MSIIVIKRTDKQELPIHKARGEKPAAPRFVFTFADADRLETQPTGPPLADSVLWVSATSVRV